MHALRSLLPAFAKVPLRVARTCDQLATCGMLFVTACSVTHRLDDYSSGGPPAGGAPGKTAGTDAAMDRLDASGEPDAPTLPPGSDDGGHGDAGNLAPATGSVACGAQSCTGQSVCCVPSVACVKSLAGCNGAALKCDGAEDCLPDETCCVKATESWHIEQAYCTKQTSCVAEPFYVVCGSSAAHCPSGYKCATVSSPPTLRLCL